MVFQTGIYLYKSFVHFVNISLMVVPLYTGLISAWLSLAGSRHRQMVPFCFGTVTKLLFHSAVSSPPRRRIIYCSCRCSTSCLNGFCNAYTTCVIGARYDFVCSLTCNENVPLKHPMPEKHLCMYYIWYCIW